MGCQTRCLEITRVRWSGTSNEAVSATGSSEESSRDKFVYDSS